MRVAQGELNGTRTDKKNSGTHKTNILCLTLPLLIMHEKQCVQTINYKICESRNRQITHNINVQLNKNLNLEDPSKQHIREIKIHVYRIRQTANVSGEFLRIETEQLKKVQNDSCGQN